MLGFKTARELIAELTIRIGTLEAEHRTLRGEFEDLWDKTVRQRARERKRAIAAAQEPPGDTNGEPPVVRGGGISRVQLRRLRRGRGVSTALPAAP